MISLGVLYRENTVLMSVYTIASASEASRYGLKHLYPLSQSTTINILSYLDSVSRSFDLGSLIMKSIAIDVYIMFGIVGGYSNP